MWYGRNKAALRAPETHQVGWLYSHMNPSVVGKKFKVGVLEEYDGKGDDGGKMSNVGGKIRNEDCRFVWFVPQIVDQ
jgi:hypothetical protein